MNMIRKFSLIGAITIALFFTFSLMRGQHVAPNEDQSAAGIVLPDGYRAATFSCW